MAQHISWSQGHSTSPSCRLSPWCELHLTVLLDFQVCYCFWAVPPTKLSVAVLSAIHFTLHFKVQMASSHRNSSTLVPPLRTPFNTILDFSDQIAYPPNMPWRSRWIDLRGHSSLRSPFSTIQSGQTVSPVPGQVLSLRTIILTGRMLPLILVLIII